jgi:diaminohydroxyphosphoribosylaminopyrimidine deaminase / 5-amino-6-(5-phosphoribosylamino)uracil reductase
MDTSPGPATDDDWEALLLGDAAAISRAPLYAPLLNAKPGPDGCFVLGRIAQTLDGRIATANGASFWISGAQDVQHTHRLRALFDAVVVGAGTVQIDDPQLTTRICSGPSPVRVIVDTERRLAPDRRVFAGGPPTLVMVAADLAGPARLGSAEVVGLPRATGGGLDLSHLLATLAARGLSRVFIEGGGITVSRFLAAGLLARLHVTIAPLLLGDGIPAFTLPGCDCPQDGMRLAWTPYMLGADMLFDIPISRARPSACL